MLVRGGERTAMMGLTNPSVSRKTTTRIAEMLAANLKPDRPDARACRRRSA